MPALRLPLGTPQPERQAEGVPGVQKQVLGPREAALRLNNMRAMLQAVQSGAMRVNS